MPHQQNGISVIVPTYRRERHLVDTLRALVPLCRPGDEILVIDQTPLHDEATEIALREMSQAGSIRWIRKTKPSQAEAINVAAHLAKGEILVILDDDIMPSPTLLEGHREVLSGDDQPPATCGQVLQPWDARPIDEVDDFGIGFNAAYSKPCEIVSLMAGNFAMRRETFLGIGGMDENFVGSNYRNDAEMAHRIVKRTGRKVRFVPEATLRHLLAAGGNRAFGEKDTWGHIGGSIGDYYFAIRCLAPAAAVKHSLHRLVRAPVSRHTFGKPWLILSLALRELVAFVRAAGRALGRSSNYIKPLLHYRDVEL
jgi:GT2 family glycosyltransferase